MANNAEELDLNNRYLQAESRQVAILIRGQLLEKLSNHHEERGSFPGLCITRQDIEKLLLNDTRESASLTEEDVKGLLDTLSNAQTESRQVEELAEAHGIRLNLLKLRQYFNLSDFEYASFLLFLLPALDLRYEQVYGYLQDDVTRKNASVDLILRTLEREEGISRLAKITCFSANGTLIRYRLLRPINSPETWLEPRLNQLFEVPPSLVAWLLGSYFPETPWMTLLPRETLDDLITDHPGLESFKLDEQILRSQLPLIALDGPDSELCTQAAYLIARQFGMPVIEVDLSTMTEETVDPAIFRLMIRDACLQEAILFIQGWEKVLTQEGFVPGNILLEMTSFAGLFVLSSNISWRVSQEGGRPVLQIHFDIPNSAERSVIWMQELGDKVKIPTEKIQTLSSQFTLTGSQIRNAVFTVKSKSELNGTPYTEQDLFSAARQQSSHHLEKLAQKIEPRYGWGDIVLPPSEISLLHDVVSMMRFRSVVLEEWGLGQKLAANRGLSALFTGEPGTGKTLAAQVIAAELQMDLYRVDLSNVVSKYIGETEKNLEQIFSEARNSNAVLFFDEADALFGKRSEVKDAHDRYANIEVGYLLQRMEVHDGITILATNLSANMDEAFTRRLNFIVHFPFPDDTQRLAIWRVLKPQNLPVDEIVDWEFMANSYPMAGGNIRNILVSAAYMAAQDGRVVKMDHLLQATRREMQKMGRLIRDDDYRYTPRRLNDKKQSF